VLELDGIVKSFGATVALDGVSLGIRAGEVHALIGENGAGKTTLMNVLAGAFPPDRGTMRIAGAPYRPASPRHARAAGVALIHQELSLFPHLTVTENVLVGLESARFGWLDARENRRRALAVLEAFPHPEIRPETRVADLPIAARQVVEICRAIAADARVVLMDEPTSSLQGEDVRRLFALVRRLRERGTAVVYISHFLEEVREVAERYTVLRDGRSVSTGDLGSTTDETLIAHMVGRAMGELFPARRRTDDGAVVLEVRGLRSPVLRGVDLDLRAGEVLGIAGLTGSGRTELVRALFGLDPPAAGEVRLRGRSREAAAARPPARLADGVGYLSEDRKGEGLAVRMSIADNVTLSRLAVLARRGWLDVSRQALRAAECMRAMAVRASSPLQPVESLSGGNQQKVALARLVHQDADVLLLDEPTRGIDIGSKAQVYAAIARWAEDGKAVLLVSSYLPELFGLCDRLAVMCRGRLSPVRPVADWTPEGVIQAATAADGPGPANANDLHADARGKEPTMPGPGGGTS
jgi:ribose transport system ATP-binding protein